MAFNRPSQQPYPTPRGPFPPGTRPLGPRPHGPFSQWDPHHYMSGPDAYRGSLRVPPRWDPCIENVYPFREFILDTVIWTRATDVDTARQGPPIVMSLGGLAATIAREIPADVQANGGPMDLGDGRGPQQLNAVACIRYGLSRNFGPLLAKQSRSVPMDSHKFTHESRTNP